MKKIRIFRNCLCAALAALLFAALCACSKETLQKNAENMRREQGTSSLVQTGAIFAPSTEVVSADAAGEYRYTKLPIEGYRVRSVFPADGNLIYVVATPCDASGRFLVGDNGIIPTQLIQYDLEAQQKTAFLLSACFDSARDIALSSAAIAPDGSLWALVCRFGGQMTVNRLLRILR